MAHKSSRIFSYVGQNIKKIRQAKNISQSDFASLFNLSRPSVGAYEEGRSEPKIETLIQISRHFNISVDVLLTKELSSKDIFSLGLLNKKLDKAHHIDSKVNEIVSAPFVDNNEKVNFLVSRHDKSYMENLPKLGIPERLKTVDLVIENEGTKLEVDNKGVHHGDLLFCRQESKLNNNPDQLWVILTAEGFHIGRASQEKKSVFLEYDNPIYGPKELEVDTIQNYYLIKGVYSSDTLKPSTMEERLKAIEEKLKSI